MRPALLLACAAALLASPVLAEDACKDLRWSVVREQAAFADGSLPTVASGSPLPNGNHAAVLKLAPQAGVAFPVGVARKPKHEPAYAGAYVLPPLAAGSYQVTVSDDAWIEVAQGGKLLKQAGFTGSRTCPGVHKSVRFVLAAEPATIEISDAGQDTIKLAVMPKE